MSNYIMKPRLSMESTRYTQSFPGCNDNQASLSRAAIVDNRLIGESEDSSTDGATTKGAEGFHGSSSVDEAQNGTLSNDLVQESSTIDRNAYIFVSLEGTECTAEDVLSVSVLADMSIVCSKIDSHLHEIGCPVPTSDSDKEDAPLSSQDICRETLITTVAAAHEISPSCIGLDSVTFATDNQEHHNIRTKMDSPTDFVLISTTVDEWNLVQLQTESETSIYSSSDNAGRSECNNNTISDSIIHNAARKFNVDLILGADSALIANLTLNADLARDAKDVMQITSTECSLSAKKYLTESEYNFELLNFPVLKKKYPESEIKNADERSKRTNDRRRRINIDRTKRSRKWKANSLCEEVVGNFNFSLFPYRAEHMTTDVEELEYMDAQLAKLEASVRSEGVETTPVIALKSSTNAVTSPQSLVEIVTRHIARTIPVQSNPPTQCSVLDASRTQKGDDKNSKIDVKLGHESRMRREPSLYFSDMRSDVLTIYEDKLCQCHTSRSMTVDGLFDLQDRGAVVRLRHKKKWRIEKARIQIKSKYCQNVSNTAHGRLYYVHHRVTKLMPLCTERVHYSTMAQLSTRRIDKTKGRTSTTTKEYLKTFRAYKAPVENSQRVVRPPRTEPVPRYAMNQNNADAALSADLINVLIGMQDRDLSPEDYELLLRLDERVAPRTFDASELDKLKTDVVGEECEDLGACIRDDVCTICMELYELGQRRKYLPCGHGFHVGCIDSWLMNASINCPLDGQEVRL